MLTPAWRLPSIIVFASLLAGVALPGVAPAPFFAGVIAAWVLAALAFAVRRKRGRSADPDRRDDARTRR